MWAPGGEDRPYKCPERIYTVKGGQKSNKAYYIRKGARTLKANRNEERELISVARDVPFDDRINYQAEVAALKPALLADYLHSVGSSLYQSVMDRSVEDVGTDMQIVRGPSEYKKPVNVGLMFFNDNPEAYFSCARIEVIDKPDPTCRGMTEKMEINSLPGPDRSISDESLENRVLVSRRYRNRRIGDYLKELDIVEGRNTGIPTILEAMEKNGSGLPSFETDGERSYFVTILPVHPAFLQSVAHMPVKDTLKPAIRKSQKELCSLVLKTLAQKGNLSTNEVAAHLGYAKTTDTLRRVVRSLIESGKISYLYPDKPRSRNQKLCLMPHNLV